MAAIVFKPKIQKIIEIILYIAEKKPGIDHYHILKIIYLADKFHMEKYCRTITLDNYAALEFGPVPSASYDLLKGKTKMDLPFIIRKVDRVMTVDKLKRACNLDYLSESDVEVLDEAIDKYSGCTFGDLVDLTHKDKAWQQAWEARGTKLSSPIPFEDLIPDKTGKRELVEDLEAICQFI